MSAGASSREHWSNPSAIVPNWVLVGAYWREHLAMTFETTLVRDTAGGPRENPPSRVSE